MSSMPFGSEIRDAVGELLAQRRPAAGGRPDGGRGVDDAIPAAVFTSHVSVALGRAGIDCFRVGDDHVIGVAMAARSIAAWAEMLSARGQPASAIADRIERLLSTGEVPGRRVLLAWGPTIRGARVSVDDVQVHPVSDLDAPGGLAGVTEWFGGAHMFRIASGAPPTIAIVTRCCLRPALCTQRPALAVSSSQYRRLTRVAMMLSLQGGGPVIPACGWFEPDDGDWSEAFRAELTPHGPREGDLPNYVLTRDYTFDADAIRLCERALQSTEKSLERMEAIAVRLNRAASSLDSGQSALDVGIALEVCFLADDGAGSELTEKLAVRAAWLNAPTDGRERLRIYATVRRLYGMRSGFAHRGATPTGDVDVAGERLSPRTIVDRAADIARSSILKILTTAVPDWKRVVLDAGTDVDRPPPSTS